MQRIYNTIIDYIQRKCNELWLYGITPATKDATDMLGKEFDTVKALYKKALETTERLQTKDGKTSGVGG